MNASERTQRALERLEPFAGSDPDALEAVAPLLREVTVPSGTTIMRRGEPGGWFAIVVDGEAAITRDDEGTERDLGTLGPGSVLGELALLTHTHRTATATATTPMTAFVGNAAAFARLLELDSVRARLRRTAAQRLAAHAQAVTTTLRDGTEVRIRPGLPTDRDRLVRGLQQMSEESRRHRFFSGGPVPKRVIDYLLDVDYIDHFAWVVTDTDDEGVGSARSIRSSTDADVAEVALGVIDDYQGRGVGTLLIGALAAAASGAGIARFRAVTQEDNAAIRRLLDKAGARWTRDAPGVLAATIEVAIAREAVDPGLADELEAAADQVIAAAHLVLG